VRICTIEKQAFGVVESWLATQRALWEARTDRLEQFVMAEQNKETAV
jgi:hypothetical protein